MACASALTNIHALSIMEKLELLKLKNLNTLAKD